MKPWGRIISVSSALTLFGLANGVAAADPDLEWACSDYQWRQQMGADGDRQCGGTRPAAPGGSQFIERDGVYRVGIDIQPGTYQSVGTTAYACTWFRHAGLGVSGDIIDAGSSTGQQFVQIASSDGSFETSGCTIWFKIS